MSWVGRTGDSYASLQKEPETRIESGTKNGSASIFGIGLILVGMLVLIGLSVLALRSGHWPGISLVDAIAFISPATSARMAIALSDSDIFFFVLADSPLYGWLLGAGTALFVSAMLSRQT